MMIRLFGPGEERWAGQRNKAFGTRLSTYAHAFPLVLSQADRRRRHLIVFVVHWR